jgi:hypothetical protein
LPNLLACGQPVNVGKPRVETAKHKNLEKTIERETLPAHHLHDIANARKFFTPTRNVSKSNSQQHD